MFDAWTTRCSRAERKLYCRLAIVAIVIAGAIFGTIRTDHGQDPQYVDHRPYVVSPYETLWDVARSATGCSYVDTKTIVDKIRQMNHLTSDKVKPGEPLTLPVCQ